MGENLNAEGARDLWQRTELRLSELPSKDMKSLTAEEKIRRWMAMLVTIGALLPAKIDGVGFIAGLLLHGAY